MRSWHDEKICCLDFPRASSPARVRTSVVLGKEKHGYFIYVGTTSQLGGKGKVSKYTVVEVKQFVVKQNAAK